MPTYGTVSGLNLSDIGLCMRITYHLVNYIHCRYTTNAWAIREGIVDALLYVDNYGICILSSCDIVGFISRIRLTEY